MLQTPPTPLIRLGNLFPERQVHAKCEFVAPSGCFKIRGAVHLLTHLSKAGQKRLLVVPSMGNTALGMAVAAREFGFRMVGVVPQTIGRAKDERLQALGVELIKVAGGGTALLERATQVAQERDGYFVHPHLDPLWTDGYQSMMQEIVHALPGCRSIVFPVGGGGLLMGLTEYLLAHPAHVTLVGCEAYNAPTYAPYHHARAPTIADGLLLEVPHPKVQERIAQAGVAIRLVRDAAIQKAMADLYANQGLVVEPSSAVTVALVQMALEELLDPICVVLTGENIAREDFYRLIAPELPPLQGGFATSPRIARE
ncbi:MAG: PLP-dependent lyase/thiolase [Tepidisphaerales bacterium]